MGVGIAGAEGREAVNASDFAIGQFRFLRRLGNAPGFKVLPEDMHNIQREALDRDEMMYCNCLCVY